MLDPHYKRRLRRLRARASLRGIGVLTSRKAISANHLGGIMLTDRAANTVIGGGTFNLSIEEAEARVDALVADIESKSFRFGGGL